MGGYVDRVVFRRLVQWKDASDRLPVLLRGARQEGATAKQWVDQELLANMDPNESPQIYFWARDKAVTQKSIICLLLIA